MMKKLVGIGLLLVLGGMIPLFAGSNSFLPSTTVSEILGPGEYLIAPGGKVLAGPGDNMAYLNTLADQELFYDADNMNNGCRWVGTPPGDYTMAKGVAFTMPAGQTHIKKIKMIQINWNGANVGASIWEMAGLAGPVGARIWGAQNLLFPHWYSWAGGGSATNYWDTFDVTPPVQPATTTFMVAWNEFVVLAGFVAMNTTLPNNYYWGISAPDGYPNWQKSADAAGPFFCGYLIRAIVGTTSIPCNPIMGPEAFGTWPPAGWTIKSDASGPWNQLADPSTPAQGMCAHVYWSPNPSPYGDTLLTPVTDLSTWGSTRVRYWYHIDYYGTSGTHDNMVEVKGSIDGGATFPYTIKQYPWGPDPGTGNAKGNEDIDISSWADGKPNVRIAFISRGSSYMYFDNHWIDDVQICGITGGGGAYDPAAMDAPEPPTQVNPGQTYNPTCLVRNIGTLITPGPVGVWCFIDDDNTGTRVFDDATEILQLGPGSEEYAMFGNWVPEAGHSYLITFQIDHTTVPDEATEANNEYIYNVSSTLNHDFAAVNCYPPPLLVPDTLAGNTEITPRMKVKNQGTEDETGVPVNCIIDGTPHDTKTVDLVVGDTAWVDFNTWNTGSAEKDYEIMFVTVLGTDQDPKNDTMKTTVHVTAVGISEGARVARTALTSIKPNPFFGSTQIFYQLSSRSEVGLRIYDRTGRLVKTLVAGTQGAGYLSVTWDGRDDLGREIPKGIYFVRMETSNYTATEKIILIR